MAVTVRSWAQTCSCRPCGRGPIRAHDRHHAAPSAPARVTWHRAAFLRTVRQRSRLAATARHRPAQAGSGRHRPATAGVAPYRPAAARHDRHRPTHLVVGVLPFTSLLPLSGCPTHNPSGFSSLLGFSLERHRHRRYLRYRQSWGGRHSRGCRHDRCFFGTLAFMASGSGNFSTFPGVSPSHCQTDRPRDSTGRLGGPPIPQPLASNARSGRGRARTRARARARMRAASPSSSPSGRPSPPRLSVGERCFCAAPDLYLATAVAAISGRRWHRGAAPFISPSLLARSAALVRFWGARYGTWRASLCA